MLRFLLLIILAWLIGKVLRAVIVALTQRASPKARRKYDVGSATQPSASAEFKDVEDAEFEEITDPKSSPK